MRALLTGFLSLFAEGLAVADDASDLDKLDCSGSGVALCFESAECMEAQPWKLDLPQCVLIDLKGKTA